MSKKITIELSKEDHEKLLIFSSDTGVTPEKYASTFVGALLNMRSDGKITKGTFMKKKIVSDTRNIASLGLKSREYNCLVLADIITIGQLLNVDRFRLRQIRNLGSKGIANINEALKAKGIKTENFR